MNAQKDKKNHAIIPYLGGKSRLAGQLAGQINNTDHQCYVEVFAGAAHVLFVKDPSKVEVINDLNGDLVNLYRVIQHHLEEFIRHFKWTLVSREEFDRLGSLPPEALTDIQRASRFWYRQKCGFGGKLNGNFGTATTSPPRFNLLRIEEDLSQAHLRLARVTIERLDWREVIRRYDRPHTLFYLDPPYWGNETDYGKGLFKRDDFTEMAELLAGIQGRFILSLNDTPGVRQCFKGFVIEEVRLSYSVCKGTATPARELIITRR